MISLCFVGRFLISTAADVTLPKDSTPTGEEKPTGGNPGIGEPSDSKVDKRSPDGELDDESHHARDEPHGNEGCPCEDKLPSEFCQEVKEYLSKNLKSI